MQFSNQDLLQLIQLTLGRVDSLLIAITAIAAVFGIIVAFIVGSFTIRQFNVDKEIKKYKDEIKDQKDKIIEHSNKVHEELAETSKFASEAKNQIKEELKTPLSKRTKEDLSKLQKKVEKLEEAVDIKRGEIKFDPTFSISPFSSNIIATAGGIVCKKCGRSYSDLLSTINYSTPFSEKSSECPYCGNRN